MGSRIREAVATQAEAAIADFPRCDSPAGRPAAKCRAPACGSRYAGVLPCFGPLVEARHGTCPLTPVCRLLGGLDRAVPRHPGDLRPGRCAGTADPEGDPPWARGILAGLRRIVRLRYVEEGREHIPAEPCLIVANHQSAWETLAFLVLVPDVAIVAKRELLAIPVVGWFLRRSPMIVIDRANGTQALRTMINAGREAVGGPVGPDLP